MIYERVSKDLIEFGCWLVIVIKTYSIPIEPTPTDD